MEKQSSLKSLMGPISVACVWFGTHVGPDAIAAAYFAPRS